jgi:hypothetical protein
LSEGRYGSTLINYHVFDKLGKDDDPVDLNMSLTRIGDVSPSDFDVMIFDRNQEQMVLIYHNSILKEHSERMKPHLIQAVTLPKRTVSMRN